MRAPTYRLCLDCSARCAPPAGVYRCPACEAGRQRRRNELRRPLYGGEWPAYSRWLRAQEPWCHRLGCMTPYTDDLTVDHETLATDPNPFEAVQCRSCNASHRRDA